MSAARQTFIEIMDGAYHASQQKLLLDPAGAPVHETNAARLLRNGLAVTCFAAFEGFVRRRTGEIASWLTSQSVPYSNYPKGLQGAPVHRGVNVLASFLRRDSSSSELQQAIVELGDSWTRMGSGGGWRLPHAAVLWPGSNLNAGEALEILTSFGVAADWNDIVGVAEAAGFVNLPTKQLFNEIAERRHDSAHDSSYDADILLLRATPSNLTAFAFALDVLISHSARAIARGVSVNKGRAAMALTRLDEVQGGGGWEEHAGPISRGPVGTPAAVHNLALDVAVAQCQGRLTAETDVLLVRRWDGVKYAPATWYTMGV